MADRRQVGTVLLVAGLTLAGVGTLGLALNRGDSGSTGSRSTPSGLASASTAVGATASPSPSVVPSSSPSLVPPSAEPPSVPSPTLDATTLVAAFFADLRTAIRAGNVGSMTDRLHPAVIDRYGLNACDQELGSQGADPSFDVEIIAVTAPAPWDYITDSRVTTIEDATTANANVTALGITTVRELHVKIVDGNVLWFTDCGDPLDASPSPSR